MTKPVLGSVRVVVSGNLIRCDPLVISFWYINHRHELPNRNTRTARVHCSREAQSKGGRRQRKIKPKETKKKKKRKRKRRKDAV